MVILGEAAPVLSHNEAQRCFLSSSRRRRRPHGVNFAHGAPKPLQQRQQTDQDDDGHHNCAPRIGLNGRHQPRKHIRQAGCHQDGEASKSVRANML
jgi:hypothetical protein